MLNINYVSSKSTYSQAKSSFDSVEPVYVIDNSVNSELHCPVATAKYMQVTFHDTKEYINVKLPKTNKIIGLRVSRSELGKSCFREK